MKEKWGGPDIGKGPRKDTGPRPDTGERESPVDSKGRPWPAPDVERSDDSAEKTRKRPKRRGTADRVLLAGAIAAALGTATVMNADERGSEEPSAPSVSEKKIDTQERPFQESTAERKRREETQTLLRNIVTRLESDELAKNIPMFGEQPDSRIACAFVDNWYKKQKTNIHALWEYARLNENDWNQNLNASMGAALETSKVAANGINWWFVPRKFWAPTTMQQLRHKLDTELAKQATTDTSCGKVFDMGYGYLREQRQVKNIQLLFRKLIAGFADLIAAELTKHPPEKRESDYQTAQQLSEVAAALFTAKAPQIQGTPPGVRR